MSQILRRVTDARAGLLDMAKPYLAGQNPRTPLAAPLYADLAGLPEDRSIRAQASRMRLIVMGATVEISPAAPHRAALCFGHHRAKLDWEGLGS
jgi:hypothetical protein